MKQSPASDREQNRCTSVFPGATLPTISIVTPVFNGAKFLRSTLASIQAQRYPNLEYIVCDGGSTDETPRILEEYKEVITHLIIEKDNGMYDALMKGFSRATGEILGWINSDDMLMPWCLSCVAAYFQNVHDCDWATGVPSNYDALGRLVWTAQVAPRYRRAWIQRRWYSSVGLGPIQQESTFFRRTLFEKVGGLNRTMRLAGDFELWCRFAEHAELHQLGTVVSGYRKHDTNLVGNGIRYFEEARAVRIPGGKFLGAAYSFMAFLCQRWQRKPRLDEILLQSVKNNGAGQISPH